MPKLIISLNSFPDTDSASPSLKSKFENAIWMVDLKNIAILMEETGIDDIYIDMLAYLPPLNLYAYCKSMSAIRGVEYTLEEIKNIIDNHMTNYHNQNL